MRRLLADGKELAVKGFRRERCESASRAAGRAHKEHLHDRLARARRGSERVVAHRNRPPAQKKLARFGYHPLHRALAFVPLLVVYRQEHDTGGILPRSRERYPRFLRGDPSQKAVRKRGEYTRAVSGIFFGAARAAVIHPAQDVQGIFHNTVTLLSLDIGNKAHTAGIFFKIGIV